MHVTHVNPYYFRPSEAEVLIGDSSKLRNELGWSPKYGFDEIVKEMMDYDMEHS